MTAMAVTIHIIKDGTIKDITYNLKPSSNNEETSHNINIIMKAIRRHFEYNLLNKSTE